MKRPFILALMIVCLPLSGCGSGDDPAWRAYHGELERALDAAPIERRAPPNIGAFVERRERLIEVPEVRESMRNVYALRECDITSLVAARNNQLGRVAPPSQHWLYERELWRRLTRCVASDVSESLSESDRERLLTLARLKGEWLPAVGWNALFDSDEWVQSFSRASQPLEAPSLPDMAGAFQALDYLETMVSNTYRLDWQADSGTLANHLKTLQARPLTAEVLRTLLLGAQRLEEANQLLASHLPATTCLPAWQSGWPAEVSLVGQRWLGAVNALIKAHAVNVPPAVAEYQRRWLSLETREAPWPRFQTAWLEHLALRTAYSACAPSQATD